MGGMKMGLTIAGFLAMMLGAGAQEHGRGSLAPGAGLGRAGLPAPSYEVDFGSGTMGLKANLGWAFTDWDVGPASGSHGAFVPQASIFYKTTDHLDMNLSVMYVSAEDSDGELGDNEAEMARLALGLRYWFDMHSRFAPYLGGGVGYYIVDGSTENTRKSGQVVVVNNMSVDNAPGGFLEGGVAFQVVDYVFINADMTYDFLLGSADAEINGEDEDFGMRSLALNLGVTWMF